MIPDYQSIMLPLLKFMADGKEYRFLELVEGVSQILNIAEDDRKQLLPSGQRIFDNRVGWARVYLKKAGLLEAPHRGAMKITDRGISVLSSQPSRIDVKYLRQFPEFIEFISGSKEAENIKSENIATEKDTPEELLESAYQEIRKSLAQELLARVMQISPAAFEKLVVDLLVKVGYGGSVTEAGRAIGKSGDEGIDGIIKEDKLGLDIIYLQAKRWQPGNVIGRPEIQKFVGALAGQGAKKGIFITTSSFTKEAREYQPKNETKIVLIDGDQLSQLMIDSDLGVYQTHKYEVKRVDHDYFGEE